jgi:hypothetical protein
MELKHFESRQAVVDYISSEIVDTLKDDLDRMEREDYRHYTDEDRQTMRNRIADVEAVVDTLR